MPKGYEITNKANTAKIKLVGGISWWRNGSEEFTQVIDSLLEAGVKNVETYINTPGGSLFDGMEIHNQIKRFPGSKTVTSGVLCASAGTVILLAHDKDKRKAHKNTNLMVHNVGMTINVNKESDFESKRQLYSNLMNQVAELYAQETNITKEEALDMMAVETWMSGKTLTEKGFFSSIIDQEDTQVSEDAQNVLNSYGFSIPDPVNQLLNNPPKHKPTQKPENEMKDFFGKLIMAFKLQGVTSESSEGEVLNALSKHVETVQSEAVTNTTRLTEVTNQLTNADKMITKLKADVEAHNTAKIKAVLDIAENEDQKITNAERVEFEKIAKMENGFDTVVNLIAQRPKKESLIKKIQNAGKTADTPKTVKDAVYARMAAMEKDNQ